MESVSSITAIVSAKSPSIARVTVSYEGGAQKSRRMTLGDYAELLKNAATDDVVEFKDRFRVPKELVELAYVNKSNFQALFLIPAQVFMVKYCDKDYPVPYPNLLFSIKVVAGKINSTRVFAMKENAVTDDTVLYAYPFGNVYSEGRICWGGNKIPTVSGIDSVMKEVIYLFYSAETSADLWSASYNLKTDVVGCEPILSSVYEVLSKSEAFPTDALVPTKFKLADLF